MADIKTINLYDIVPPSIRDDENVFASISAINKELNLVSQLCGVPAILYRIDELNSDQLDHLAWQYDSKVWRQEWPLSLKQSVIKTVIQEKSKKGTRTAVENALKSLGSSFEITEWFETTPMGEPFTFDVLVTLGDIEGQLPADVQQSLIDRINDTKSTRSHYTFSLAESVNAGLNLTSAARPAIYTRLNFKTAEEVFYLARPAEGRYLTQSGNNLTIY